MPTPTYVSLATITLGSTDNEIVFSSIPATYRDLILVMQARNTTSDAGVAARFNSDTGSNYTYVTMRGTGSSATSATVSTTSMNFVDAFTTVGYIGIAQIMDYSATDKHKTVLIRKGGAFEDVQAHAARWANTAAINSITLTVSNNFAIGSSFSLYGIAS